MKIVIDAKFVENVLASLKKPGHQTYTGNMLIVYFRIATDRNAPKS